MLVEYGSLTDIVLLSVERQDITGGSHPQRHNLRLYV